MTSRFPSTPHIHVTGNAGAGKSTLAATLASLLDAELVGLDAVVWRAGWQKTPRDERLRLELDIAAKKNCVVDGVSGRLRRASDMIIFLDVPRRRALWRCLRRNLPYLFRSRPGLPPDCPEWRILPTLARIIWRFPADIRPGILRDLHDRRDTHHDIHVRHPAQLTALIADAREVARLRMRSDAPEEKKDGLV